MAPTQNTSAIFNEVPQGIRTGDNTIITKVESIELDGVQLDGGMLVKMVYLSVQPYLRAMMNPLSVHSGLPSYELGKPMFGFAVAIVMRSERPDVTTGDHLYVTNCPFQQYAVLPKDHPVRIIPNDPQVPLSAYIGLLGLPGMTAFYGLELFGKLKQGETLYVSSGAGPVGLFVAQWAKLKGLKVIASASTDDKVEFMRSVGVDVPFNYKKENMKEVLAKEGPIDLYWDNIGGSTLEAALEACNLRARVVICGILSSYNAAGESYGIKTTPSILFKQLTVQGYMVNVSEIEYEGQRGNPVKFLETVTPLIKSGQLKWSEQVLDGVEHVNEAVMSVFEGTNTANVVIKANSS